MQNKAMNRQHISAMKSLKKYISENRDFFTFAAVNLMVGPQQAVQIRDLIR